jgi:hypothetical protein
VIDHGLVLSRSTSATDGRDIVVAVKVVYQS